MTASAMNWRSCVGGLVRLGREQDGRAQLAEEAEKRQRLFPELERIRRQIPELREPVHEDARRLPQAHLLPDAPRDRLPLHLRGREDVVFLAVREVGGIGAEVEKGDALGAEAEPVGVPPQLLLAFAESDEKTGLSPCGGPRQEMQSEDGFAGSRATPHHVGAARDQPSAKDLVKAWNADGNSAGIVSLWLVHRLFIR